MAKGNTNSGHWSLSTGKQEAVNGLNQISLQQGNSLAGWGFEGNVLTRRSLAPDTFRATRHVQAADVTPALDFGQLVILKDPLGVTRFVGRRVLVPASIAGGAESNTYEFAGPWYWLERLVFHQTWSQLLLNGALVARQTSHVMLNLGGVSVGTTIQTVAQYAIDQGAPFQLGTIDIPIIPIATESTDQTCAQIIIDQLRWAPDAVAWFDYSTNPPTFHCRQSDSLTAVQLTLGPNAIPTIADDGLEIVSRPDLQLPAVALRYERTDTLDGTEYLSIAEDLAPVGATGRELNALSQTISLFGFRATTLRASVLCETIDTTSLEWWKRVIPQLADPRIKNLALVAGSVQRILQGSRSTADLDGTPSSAFGRMLVEGQLVDWMRDATDNELDWEQEEINAEFSYQLDTTTSSGVKLSKRDKFRIPVHLVATTAPAGESSYSTTETEEEGETAPAGLAQYLYDALSGLEYEGSVNTTEQECSGYIGPGNVLNLGGTAQAAHASMRGRVQSVVEHLDSGQTSVSFGPTPKLHVNAIIELLRASRHRRRWTRSNVQSDGELGSSASAKLGEGTANNNTVAGDAQHKFFACDDGGKRVELDAEGTRILVTNAPSTQQIIADLAHLTGANKVAQFRETLICVMVNGVPTQQRCWILRTVGEAL